MSEVEAEVYAGVRFGSQFMRRAFFALAALAKIVLRILQRAPLQAISECHSVQF
jgi:hypothetical protein